MKNTSHVREHTPITPQQYAQRIQRSTTQQIRKRTLDTLTFFCIFGLSISMLYWGA